MKFSRMGSMLAALALCLALVAPTLAQTAVRVTNINTNAPKPPAEVEPFRIVASAGLIGGLPAGSMTVGQAANLTNPNDTAKYFKGEITEITALGTTLKLTASGTFGTWKTRSTARLTVVLDKDGKITISGVYNLTKFTPTGGRVTVYTWALPDTTDVPVE